MMMSRLKGVGAAAALLPALTFILNLPHSKILCQALSLPSSSSLTSLSPSPSPSPSPSKKANNFHDDVLFDRRSLLQKTSSAAAAASSLLFIQPTSANAITTPTIEKKKQNITPFIQLPNSPQNNKVKVKVKVPIVGYSFYKTDASLVEQCTNLALVAGVRHFDVGSLYGTNSIVGRVLLDYCENGLPSISEKGYRSIEKEGDDKKSVVVLSNSKSAQANARAKAITRRRELFITHKIKNEEQSESIDVVKQTILNEMKDNLRVSYLDMLMIHSPLTDSKRRLATYRAMVELQREGLVRSIGVCHYGVAALDEIIKAGLPPPAVIQLQLSPFNQHKDVGQWAKEHGSILSCSAWSKLSGVDGPQEGWVVLSKIAQRKGMTKAQVLVQWAIQNNYLSVPRSGAGSKIERKAIYENSLHGVEVFTALTKEEMTTLNGLDEELKAGRLGVKDGWNDDDMLGPAWDPTSLSV